MKELSLFSGAGGGLLGAKLLGWKHCGYVEYNEYCQKVIAQRIEDGILDRAPIFGDIRAFISEGYADAYQGMVDVVTAGFPCQPFSVAGKRAGADDDRNMWPQTIDVIRRVRPKFALLENVPGLLAHEYSRQIFWDLAESGYSARWRILSAAECGAPHKRDRLWIMANSKSKRKCSRFGIVCAANEKISKRNENAELSDTNSLSCTSKPRRYSRRAKQPLQRFGQNGEDREISNPRFWNGERSRRKVSSTKKPTWWNIEPDVGRVADGIPNRVDRLKALGNGQVPAVVEKAVELLS